MTARVGVTRPVMVDGYQVGKVGWYCQDGKVWLFWSILEDFRRAGHATSAMRSLLLAEAPLPAYVLIRPGNAASMALALRLGGVEIGRDQENVSFRFAGGSMTEVTAIVVQS